ncbi:MAG: Holliday junction branch migration protein RuvA [Gemmatales bacterium]|nr:helix-hairpin-helix domain-containing protein [Gemmatales bacterium]MDW8174295.1 Holliday junction branch migration protein RuvA [Gemmatales bacterium]MDW8222157.1 Holliday junction branch migration protein RuvA [Gemmatales bacterium]
MITRITGRLTRLFEESVRLEVGPMEYEVLVPALVRQNLADRLGQEITLHVSHFLEGNPLQGRMVPRLIGFLHEAEMEFFELLCTVDKVGIRRALKAITEPVRDIADAIVREDVKWLARLPGFGKASAEQVVLALKKKAVRFALLRSGSEPTHPAAASVAEERVFDLAVEALRLLGHSASEARQLVDSVRSLGPFENVEQVLLAVYNQAHRQKG